MRLAEAFMRPKRKIPEDYRPSDDEPFMNERQRAYFRRKLLAWREEILRSTKETLQRRLISAGSTKAGRACRRIWGKQQSFTKKRPTKETLLRRITSAGSTKTGRACRRI